MQARHDRVVSITFTIHTPSHEVIDAQHAYSPLAFLFGSGQLLLTLEQHLKGKRAGDAFDVTLEAAQAYGERNNQLVQKVNPEVLPAGLTEGMAIVVEVPGLDGIATPVTFRVKSIKDNLVQMDGNHPLAGQDLRFVGMIVDVRPATDEELALKRARQNEVSD